jgi:hypothetical protein
MTTEERIEVALQNKKPVMIIETDETGELLFAISLAGVDEGFWLDAFSKLKDAEKFVNQNQLPLIDIRRKPKQ